MATNDFDIAIFGAGIVGLWTLARLRRAGYRAILFESRSLGGVQSLASQGIIHGGTKYALTGRLTGSAMAIAAMPGIWRSALAGDGDLDLRGVRVLSAQQYLWSTGSLASGLAGFFAGKVMHSRIRPLARDEFPVPFDNAAFHGSVYRLDEPVLDVASLVREISTPLLSYLHHLESPPAFDSRSGAWSLDLGEGLRIRVAAVVLAAGAGNAGLLSRMGQTGPAMQLRPLHMLMLRGDLPPLYAHCLGASANPRLTLTSHPLDDGTWVWYLGGEIAETGVGLGPAEQIAAGRAALGRLLPWLDAGVRDWSSLSVQRAELACPGGRRPDDAVVIRQDRLFTCWPTKLAFAPRVAQLVMHGLTDAGISPSEGPDTLQGLAPPMMGSLPWEAPRTWS